LNTLILAKQRLVNNYYCDYAKSVDDYDACMSVFISYLSQTRLMYNPDHEHSHPYVNRLKKDTKNPHKSIALIYAKNPIIEGGVFQGKLFKKGEADPSVAQWSFNLGPKINEGILPSKRNIAAPSIATAETLMDRFKQRNEEKKREKEAADLMIANQRAAEIVARALADEEKQRQREEKQRQREEKKQQDAEEKERKEEAKAKKLQDKIKKDKRKEDQAKRKAANMEREAAEREYRLQLAEEEQSRADEEDAKEQEKKRKAQDREKYLERKRNLEMREKEMEELLELERREKEVSERLERAKQQRQQAASVAQQSITPNQEHERNNETPNQGNSGGLHSRRGVNNHSPHMFRPTDGYHTPDDYYDDRYDRYDRYNRYERYDRSDKHDRSDPHATSSRDLEYRMQQPLHRRPTPHNPVSMESHNGISFTFNTHNYQTSSNTNY
jgi:hypothetical protein